MKEKEVKKMTTEQAQDGQLKGKDGMHNRDMNSKTIFGNPVLCAQFLRDYFDVPALKGVQPEDIE